MTRTLEILADLVAFDTVSAKSNLGIIAYIEALLTRAGFHVTRLDDPDQAKAGLSAVKGPEGAGVLLSAHTDVVPVEGQPWTRDPFRLTDEGERLYGRGTTDMKGFLASALAMAERAGDLQEPLKLVISYDEEVGCLGMSRMVERLKSLIGQPRLAIVGEPTEMAPAIGHKGKVGYRALCEGEAGHSAMAPLFTNALHVATDLVMRLRGIQDDLAAHGARDDAYSIPYSTVHVGKLHGGTALNIVPDSAVLEFEVRYLANEPLDPILERITTTGVTLEPLSAYPGLDIAADHAAVTTVQRLCQSNTTPKVAYGTEAGFLSALGIPTVVCGPGSMEGQGHKADEYITRDQLAQCDAMLARLVDELR